MSRCGGGLALPGPADLVLVGRYLHRPLLAMIRDRLVAAGGAVIYHTFMQVWTIMQHGLSSNIMALITSGCGSMISAPSCRAARRSAAPGTRITSSDRASWPRHSRAGRCGYVVATTQQGPAADRLLPLTGCCTPLSLWQARLQQNTGGGRGEGPITADRRQAPQKDHSTPLPPPPLDLAPPFATAFP